MAPRTTLKTLSNMVVGMDPEDDDDDHQCGGDDDELVCCHRALGPTDRDKLGAVVASGAFNSFDNRRSDACQGWQTLSELFLSAALADPLSELGALGMLLSMSI